jgi:transcriptional regulator with XRE-family HTH domain
MTADERFAPHAYPVLTELRQMRLNHGIKQAGVARRLGVGKTTLNNWEMGARMPTLAVVVAIADALGHDVVLRPKREPADVMTPERAARNRAALAAALGFADDYEPGEVA